MIENGDYTETDPVPTSEDFGRLVAWFLPDHRSDREYEYELICRQKEGECEDVFSYLFKMTARKSMVLVSVTCGAACDKTGKLNKHEHPLLNIVSSPLNLQQGCLASKVCSKCGLHLVCDSSKAGTKEGSTYYIHGPCCCGPTKCPECGYYPFDYKEI